MFINIEDRLPYIELWLMEEGSLKPIDYANRMGISRSRAQADFRAYEALSPENNNLVYKPNIRTYLTSDKFKPCFNFDPLKREMVLKHGWMITKLTLSTPKRIDQ